MSRKNLKFASMAFLALGLEDMVKTTQIVTKSMSELGRTLETSKQGQKTFTYDDGFQCQALNQKSADKKHSKWLSSTELKED